MSESCGGRHASMIIVAWAAPPVKKSALSKALAACTAKHPEVALPSGCGFAAPARQVDIVCNYSAPLCGNE